MCFCSRRQLSAVPTGMPNCLAGCSACCRTTATMLHRGFMNAGTPSFSQRIIMSRCMAISFVMLSCSCNNEEESWPGKGVCGEPSSSASAPAPLQSDSSESDRCAAIGVLHQPAEYPIVAVATKHFVVPDDGRVCAIILGSSNADGASRWCSELPSQVINLKGILPGSWAVRIETVDWCVNTAK